MEERQSLESKNHKVVIHNRKNISLTGVQDVLSFDATEILLDTVQGMLMLRGRELHVNRLSLDKGEVDVDGRIDSFAYAEEQGKTKYWLYKQLGMSYQNFSRMVNNETKSIRYENIETICLLLNCTPNDLFEITED